MKDKSTREFERFCEQLEDIKINGSVPLYKPSDRWSESVILLILSAAIGLKKKTPPSRG